MAEEFELLVVNVDCWVWIGLEDFFIAPSAECFSGSFVAGGFRFRKFEANDVIGGGLVEFRLQVSIDHIVGWGDTIGE